MTARREVSLDLTEAELERFGRRLGRVAFDEGVFVCLYGELGAGKSTLARAACRGAGVTGPVPSPTFTLVNQYEVDGGAAVQHADLYRVDTVEGLLDMGWEALVQSDGAVFVEWADRATAYLPSDRWDIRLDFVDSPSRRRVGIVALGSAPPIPGAEAHP
ncbi:MAG: tRNA (adenosine(37)-N6)-threonylcarbamoyltransferase complex ATPase subunit type 1 TsaE [Gemmatimonadetes bacterium]|nr:tRNA (adenosine(37)-N6)-threonylcarbamoyltransferase complex ATPase subunit type 1 TsaE [Gemmatimonadota bacterium]